MKKITAALLALVLILGMTACGAFEETETIYVKTQSLRTIGEQTIRMEYTNSKTGVPVSVKTYFNDVLYQTASTRTSGGVTYQTIVDQSGASTTQSTSTTKDAKGNVVMLEISVGTTTVSRTTYTYDEQNRLTKGNTLTSLGVTDVTYTYDNAGNVAEKIVDDAANSSYIRTVYTYDARNYIQEEKSYDKNGALMGSIRYTYSADGRNTVMESFDAEGNATGEKVESQYDEHGNLIKEITSLNGEILQTTVNTYEALEVPVEK